MENHHLVHWYAAPEFDPNRHCKIFMPVALGDFSRITSQHFWEARLEGLQGNWINDPIEVASQMFGASQAMKT
jgi:hypothetical protein